MQGLRRKHWDRSGQHFPGLKFDAFLLKTDLNPLVDSQHHRGQHDKLSEQELASPGPGTAALPSSRGLSCPVDIQ